VLGRDCAAGEPLKHLRQIGTDQVAAIVQLWRVPLWAVAVELLLPFHHVGAAAVLLDQPADAIAALALAARAFDAQHVELALDVAKYEIGAGHRGLSANVRHAILT
jgi:hypothetical protein